VLDRMKIVGRERKKEEGLCVRVGNRSIGLRVRLEKMDDGRGKNEEYDQFLFGLIDAFVIKKRHPISVPQEPQPYDQGLSPPVGKRQRLHCHLLIESSCLQQRLSLQTDCPLVSAHPRAW